MRLSLVLAKWCGAVFQVQYSDLTFVIGTLSIGKRFDQRGADTLETVGIHSVAAEIPLPKLDAHGL